MNSTYENNNKRIYFKNQEEFIEDENKSPKENIFLPVEVEKYLNVIFLYI